MVTGLIYLQIGNYKLKDNPFSDINLIEDNLNQTRLNQINAENLIENKDTNFQKNDQLIELVNKLKEILKNRPNDSKGYNLLVRIQLDLGISKLHIMQWNILSKT